MKKFVNELKISNKEKKKNLLLLTYSVLLFHTILFIDNEFMNVGAFDVNKINNRKLQKETNKKMILAYIIMS